jgi:hypothetical protein
MASNTSQRKLHSIVMESRVDAFASWDLIVRCGSGCVRSVPMSGLPEGITVARLLIRMRCQTCGSPVERAILDNCVSGWQRRILRVRGPGSYG